jgi:hypothetical protein
LITESEIIKFAVNNGLMAVFVLWYLFRGEPQNRETIKSISADHRTTMEAMAGAHKTTLETVSKEFRAALVAQQQECREERAELLRLLTDEAEKNRAARHKQGELLQSAVAEISDIANRNHKGPK